MRVALIGFERKNAAQEMAGLFFPGSVTGYSSSEDADITIKLEIDNCKDGLLYTVSVARANDGSCAVGREIGPICDAKGGELPMRRAFFRAARDITGVLPPWGVLTGIRPAKLIRSLVKKHGSIGVAAKLLEDEYLVGREKRDLALRVYNNEEAAISRLLPFGASLYIAIPFCPSRCAYCTFVSHSVDKAKKLIEPYVSLLCSELSMKAELLKRREIPIQSVYIGGGTPTALTAGQLREIMSTVKRDFCLDNLLEYTVECGRPDTVTEEKLSVIKELGADRISINPQTMNDETLNRVGRPHSSLEVEAAFEMARRAGFSTINADLIAGLPGEKALDFERSLSRVLELGAENITVHTLSYKKGSALTLEGDMGEKSHAAQMVSTAFSTLIGASYEPYYLYRQKKVVEGNGGGVSSHFLKQTLKL